MRGDNQSYLDVQGSASSGPVCAFITSPILELKVISDYMKRHGFSQRPQVRSLAAFLLAEANLVLQLSTSYEIVCLGTSVAHSSD